MSDIDPIFTGVRVETHWTELLDSDDNVVAVLDGVSGGTVAQNIDARIRGGYSFTLTTTEVSFDWMTARFRPWVMVNGQRWPLGVFLASSPELGKEAAVARIKVAAHDKLIILDQDKIVETYSLEEGTEVVPVVVGIIQAAGESAIAVTSSAAALRTAMTWPVGTPWLTVCNELLGHVNYGSLWCDGYGQYRIEPAVEPRDRDPVYTFRRGEASIHSPTWGRSQDIASVPNRVVLTTTGTDEVEEMVAVAENTDPTSPYSYQARGNRWVTRPYENVNAADQATLDALARRYLANATRAVAHLNVSHAVVPLDPGAVVRFVSDPYIDVIAQVNEYSIPLQPGALVSAMWSEVITS
ncbi:MAG TPA: hypothetical protein GX718_05445 [Brevibacterium sp.]|nr:hypothetical protein [Brevibacterium sp.]